MNKPTFIAIYVVVTGFAIGLACIAIHYQGVHPLVAIPVAVALGSLLSTPAYLEYRRDQAIERSKAGAPAVDPERSKKRRAVGWGLLITMAVFAALFFGLDWNPAASLFAAAIVGFFTWVNAGPSAPGSGAFGP